MRSRRLTNEVHPVLSIFFLNDPPTSVYSSPFEPCNPIATVGSSGCNLLGRPAAALWPVSTHDPRNPLVLYTLPVAHIRIAPVISED